MALVTLIHTTGGTAEVPNNYEKLVAVRTGAGAVTVEVGSTTGWQDAVDAAGAAIVLNDANPQRVLEGGPVYRFTAPAGAGVDINIPAARGT